MVEAKQNIFNEYSNRILYEDLKELFKIKEAGSETVLQTNVRILVRNK